MEVEREKNTRLEAVIADLSASSSSHTRRILAERARGDVLFSSLVVLKETLSEAPGFQADVLNLDEALRNAEQVKKTLLQFDPKT